MSHNLSNIKVKENPDQYNKIEPIIAHLVENAILCYEQRKYRAEKAIGRYRGWVLIFGDLATEISKNYSSIKEMLNKKNYQIIRWSNLSHDNDDGDDFGLRFGVGSI